MKYLRSFWFDFGMLLALAVTIYLGSHPTLSNIQFLLGVSLVSLFVHQREEYRRPGGFGQMLNRVMYDSKTPDTYPLNSNTALIINIFAWVLYGLAAYFAEDALWLGIAALTVSLGNFLVHTFVFNIRGNTRYNPGMASAILLFLPLVWIFVDITRGVTAWSVYGRGIALGVVVSILIPVTIRLLSDEKSRFSFAGKWFWWRRKK